MKYAWLIEFKAKAGQAHGRILTNAFMMAAIIAVIATCMFPTIALCADGNNLLPTSGATRYDFEGGATWSEWGTAASITNSTTFAHGGTASCKFTDLTTLYTGREIASESVTATAGDTFNCRIWA